MDQHLLMSLQVHTPGGGDEGGHSGCTVTFDLSTSSQYGVDVW